MADQTHKESTATRKRPCTTTTTVASTPAAAAAAMTTTPSSYYGTAYQSTFSIEQRNDVPNDVKQLLRNVCFERQQQQMYIGQLLAQISCLQQQQQQRTQQAFNNNSTNNNTRTNTTAPQHHKTVGRATQSSSTTTPTTTVVVAAAAAAKPQASPQTLAPLKTTTEEPKIAPLPPPPKTTAATTSATKPPPPTKTDQVVTQSKQAPTPSPLPQRRLRLSYEERMKRVRAFKEKYGHIRITRTRIDPEYQSGESQTYTLWCTNFRDKCHQVANGDHTVLVTTAATTTKETTEHREKYPGIQRKHTIGLYDLTPKRYEEWKALGVLKWFPAKIILPWETRYKELVEFHKQNGHCNVPKRL